MYFTPFDLPLVTLAIRAYNGVSVSFTEYAIGIATPDVDKPAEP